MTDPAGGRPGTLRRVEETLGELVDVGTFATRRRVASNDLHLAVDGVGAIRLPVSARQARQLIGVTKPYPSGAGARC